MSRISLARVAENIITCLWCGVTRKISWTSRRISKGIGVVDDGKAGIAGPEEVREKERKKGVTTKRPG